VDLQFGTLGVGKYGETAIEEGRKLDVIAHREHVRRKRHELAEVILVPRFYADVDDRHVLTWWRE
jgi:hypothetical protein